MKQHSRPKTVVRAYLPGFAPEINGVPSDLVEAGWQASNDLPWRLYHIGGHWQVALPTREETIAAARAIQRSNNHQARADAIRTRRLELQAQRAPQRKRRRLA